MSELANNLAVLLPELILAVSAMGLLMLGAVRGDRDMGVISFLAVVAIAVAAYVLLAGGGGTDVAFGGALVVDGFARFAKVLVLLGSALTLIMSQDYMHTVKLVRFEFPILVLLATVGMLLMVSSASFISLYMGLELQSLSLYVLAAFNRDSLRSSEAGLKYFVLGALSSGMMLYGITLIYGFTGSTEFATVAAAVSGQVSIGLIFGIVFLIAGLAFKVSAVPFHMWTPDVYEGAPTPVTAFFSMAPKVAAMALFLRAILEPFPNAVHEWRQVIVLISALSMILGAFAAIGQTNIKRLMAYSSIGHMGYALLGLAAGTAAGVQGVLIYLAIYLVSNAGVFVVIMAMKRDGEMVEDIADLAGLSRTQPRLAFVMAALMISLAGIPPLAGFWAKFYVFLSAIEAHLYTLAVLGVVTSVVGAYYYWRIVKLMYFDEPARGFDRDISFANGAILTGVGIFTLFFIVGGAPLISAAGHAAAALFP